MNKIILILLFLIIIIVTNKYIYNINEFFETLLKSKDVDAFMTKLDTDLSQINTSVDSIHKIDVAKLDEIYSLLQKNKSGNTFENVLDFSEIESKYSEIYTKNYKLLNPNFKASYVSALDPKDILKYQNMG